MFKIFTLLTSLIFLSTGCTLVRNYKDITKAPERIYQDLEMPSKPSNIDVALKMNFASLEQEINSKLENNISDKDDGTVEYKSWIKTRDPLYHPNEWIKTKDPLYNPNEWLETKNPLYNPKKWIKVGFIKTKNPLYDPRKWFKTKDPLYHPNEWIATKDPLYNPNEWLETRGPAVAVGYTYEYTITKIRPIKISYVDDNTLKITAPIKFNGSAGLQGPAAAALTLNKKNFQGAIEFYANVGFSIDSTWQPVVTTSITHDWLNPPVVEIIDGINISLTHIADSYIRKMEREINLSIADRASSTVVRDYVNSMWKHYSFQLDSLPNGKRYFVNINPLQASMSRLRVKRDSLELFLGLAANISIDNKLKDVTQPLPFLHPKTSTPSQINAYVPIAVKYIDIEENINKYLSDNDVVVTSKLYRNKEAKIKLNKIEVLPYGDELTMGVNLKVKLPGNLFPAFGTVYLTALPVIKNGSKVELDSIKLSMSVNNKLYPAVAAAFKESIIETIKEKAVYDLSKNLRKVEAQLTEQAQKLDKNDKISVSTAQMKANLYDIEILKDELVIIAEINSDLIMALRKPKLASNK